jgi:hypothetical protein
MIDAGKLDELLKQLSELIGGGSSDSPVSKKPDDKKKQRLTVMTVEMGKGVKIPKPKKKPSVEEMLEE